MAEEGEASFPPLPFLYPGTTNSRKDLSSSRRHYSTVRMSVPSLPPSPPHEREKGCLLLLLPSLLLLPPVLTIALSSVLRRPFASFPPPRSLPGPEGGERACLLALLGLHASPDPPLLLAGKEVGGNLRVGGWMNELLLRSLWTEEDWGSSRKARVGEGRGKRLLSSLLRRRSQTASRSISTDGRRRRQFGFAPSRRRVAWCCRV